MSNDVYIRLREFLHGLPAGFPATESGVELKILEKLYTPEQAEMAMCTSTIPETVSAIAARRGMDESEAAELLASMAKLGLLYRVRLGEDVLYMTNMFAVGVYEFNLNRIDREFAEMFEEYQPSFSEFMRSIPTKQLRVVPVAETIDAVQSVASYNQVRELVAKHHTAAVATCICRKERGLLGYECQKPHETCLTFGMAAQYYVENGIGREITIDEALRILDQAEEAGLVLMPTNAVHIMNICCCCGCCCGVLRTMSADPRPADLVQSSYQASIEEDLCDACSTCLERCQIEAITEAEGGDVMVVDTARCIGCGLCVSTCPQEAISLVEKAGVEAPAADIVKMWARMAEERGLGGATQG